MDIIDSGQAVSTIVGGTSGYLVEFAPFFLFVLGFALALAVISGILGAFFPQNRHNDDESI